MTAAMSNAMPWTTGDELRLARTRAHLKGEELAEILGVTAKTIYRWEDPKNAAEPSISQWRKIAKACDAPWLLTGGDRVVTKNDAPSLVLIQNERLPFDLPPCKTSPTLTAVD